MCQDLKIENNHLREVGCCSSGALRGASVSFAQMMMMMAEISTSGWTKRNNGLLYAGPPASSC